MSIQLSPVGGLGFTQLGTWTSFRNSWITFYNTMEVDKYNWYLFEAELGSFKYRYQYGSAADADYQESMNVPYCTQWVSKYKLRSMNTTNLNELKSILFSTYLFNDKYTTTIGAVAAYRYNTFLCLSGIKSLRVYGIEGV